MKKIIFVCHGNICRSPMAEFIFKKLTRGIGMEEDFDVSSAAVSYEEEGNDIYHYAADTLQRHDIPFGEHRAHRITKREYEEADLVIVMDSSNLRLLEKISTNTCKAHKLLEYTGENSDVADPWYTGNFEQAYTDILRGCRALLNHLTTTNI